MHDDGIGTFLMMCGGGTRLVGDDRITAAVLVHCAAAVAADDVDCPLGALVLAGDPAAPLRSARRVLEQDARAIDPGFLSAIVDCATRRRLGAACPLVRVKRCEGASASITRAA